MLPRLGVFIALAYRRVKVDVENDGWREREKVQSENSGNLNP
jgi:hypothetical protein